jgi:hypothetical protein
MISEWFDIVAAAMTDGREVGLDEIREHFAASGEPLDGKPYDPNDRAQSDKLTDALVRCLDAFERIGLVRGHAQDHHTPNLRLRVKT